MTFFNPYVRDYDDPDKPMAFSEDPNELIDKALEIVMEKYNRDIKFLVRTSMESHLKLEARKLGWKD